MEKAKRKLPWWGIVFIVIAGLAVLFGLVVAGLNIYMRGSVSDYYKASEKTFVIPDADNGFIAQGIAYEDNYGCFLVTGYMNDGSPSPIHAVCKQNSKFLKSVSMKLEDGTPYYGHAGGIAVYGDNIYIAGGSDHCLYVFSLGDMKDAVSGASITAKGRFELKSENDHINAAFVTVYDGKILVGEFYREQNYKTLESHHVEVSGGTNRALAVAYNLDETAQFGISPEPVEAFSLPDQVQGMCFNGDNVYVSTSYGMAFSHVYNYSLQGLASGTMNVLGKETKTYFLDDRSLVSDSKIAPMSEEIEIVDGKMYVMCESASNKYIFGKFTGGKWCYATDIDFFSKKD